MEADKCLLPDIAITEFIQLYQQEFGQTISHQEASQRANNLFLLYRSIHRSKNKIVRPP